jgi:hypothetical protein
MNIDEKWRAIVSYLYGVDENWKLRQSDPVRICLAGQSVCTVKAACTKELLFQGS